MAGFPFVVSHPAYPVLVDGQPVNSGWNGSVDWTMILWKYKKVEVLRGAASSFTAGVRRAASFRLRQIPMRKGFMGNMTLLTEATVRQKQVYDVSVRKDKWDIGDRVVKNAKTDGWRGYYVDSRVLQQ